jgi:hypothetical protein
MSLPNRHPVDELADIRAERRRLDEREAQIRAALLAGGASLVGNEYTATVAAEQQRRLNHQLLEQRFGPEAVNQCKAPVVITTIRLKPRG